MATESDTQRLHLTVNGDHRTLPDGATVPALLSHLGIDPESATGVAVARNGTVVRRQDWGDTALEDGDTLEVIQAQQGG